MRRGREHRRGWQRAQSATTASSPSGDRATDPCRGRDRTIHGAWTAFVASPAGVGSAGAGRRFEWARASFHQPELSIRQSMPAAAYTGHTAAATPILW